MEKHGANQVVWVDVRSLKGYAKNSRTHSAKQIKQIASSIKQFGFTNPVLVSSEGEVIAGHGRLEAAKLLGLAEIPTITLGYLDETQRRALVIADNKIAEGASWDSELLAAELGQLMADGFDLDSLGLLEMVKQEIDDETYTKKIQAPTYQPDEEVSPIVELYDETKVNELLAKIQAADLGEDEKAFLRLAAQRHRVFNFRKIANYYASANPVMQDLMERSALVIIDYGKAIENGYVRLSAGLAALYDEEYGEND